MKMTTNLAWSNIKKDRTRSILIIISILMTTILLTMIFTIGYGMMKTNQVYAGAWYGDYYGFYKNVSEEQTEQMRLRSEFTDIGMTDIFGMVDSDRDLFLVWSDEMSIQMNNMTAQLEKGHFPQTGNEIAAQPDFFWSLGMDEPQIGDKIVVPCRMNLNSVYEPEEFIISGLLKEPDIQSGSSAAMVSEEFYKEHVSIDERNYKVYFRMDKSLGITSDGALDFMKEVAEKIGIDEKDVDDNYVYLMWKLDPGTETLLMCGMIAFVVICFAVIVIYNIFQVGIVQKIQEYGKLKAIGATKRQMRQTVFREGMFLAGVGVPIGILTGYGLSGLTLDWMLGLMADAQRSMPDTDVSIFSLPLLLLAGALSIFSVILALRKPMKIVASISPVEAMRYQENSGKAGGQRKGRRLPGVLGLTFANLSANKWRTISTIISMGLSCVLFVVLANCIGNMDMEYDARRTVPHGQFQISLDYSMHDMAYPENNLDYVLENNPLDNELIAQIKEMEQVMTVRTGNKLYAVRQDKEGVAAGEVYSILILDREDFEREYQSAGTLGEFTYDEVAAENGIIYGWSYSMEQQGYFIGEELKLQGFDGKQKKDIDTVLMGSFGAVNADLAMTEDTFEKLGFSREALDTIWIDCKDADIDTVQSKLNELLSGKEHVELISFQKTLETSESSIWLMKVCGYTICLMIAFISFMNMANTMITSIVTRKQEFGILQAVGMTNRQMNQSLQLEGIFFTLGPVLVSMLVGIPLGYAAFYYGKTHAFIGMNIYHFPVLEIVCMFLLLAAMQMILSFILSRNVKKESLVERIRYQG